MNAFQVADASALAVRKMPTQLNIRHEDTSRGGGLPGHPQGAGVGQQGGGDARRPGGSGGWATVSPASPLAPALLAHITSQPLSKRRGEAASDDGSGQVKAFAKFDLLLSRGVATWLESGREKRNLGMAGLTAVLQVNRLVKDFEVETRV